MGPPDAAATTAPAFPRQALDHLDTLWIQVAGTLCNLACTHCFVSCGPGDARHGFMTRAEVRDHVADAVRLGVREFYFTGGEPFLHGELLEILDDTLRAGPCTVLTNGTLVTEARARRLADLGVRSRHALEIRVSLDGPAAPAHDAIRGPGGFERALAGIVALCRHGLLPIVTVTRDLDQEEHAVRDAYAAMLRAAGVARPRLKVMPMFRFGREAARSRGYGAAETLAGLEPAAFAGERLQCASCRAVTSRGAYVCPLLVDEPGGRLGARLDEALHPFTLAHGACYTCWVTGMTCANG